VLEFMFKTSLASDSHFSPYLSMSLK